ncbi:MAG: beta strand repeat-containing protein, partial [Terriglobia bacterium]
MLNSIVVRNEGKKDDEESAIRWVGAAVVLLVAVMLFAVPNSFAFQIDRSHRVAGPQGSGSSQAKAPQGAYAHSGQSVSAPYPAPAPMPLAPDPGPLAVCPGGGTCWQGGTTGNWSTGGNWSAGVPSSSTDVYIDNGNPQASAVTLDIAGNAANLTVDNDDSLSFNDGTSLTVGGASISNAGNISMNSASHLTDLILNASTVTLSGGGTLTLSNSIDNRIYSTASSTFVNQETIQGAGQLGIGGGGFGFALDNTGTGTIDANQSNTLFVSPGNGVTNTGTLEATAGGTLELDSGTYTNAGGTVLADGSGSAVVLVGATINGGTLTTTNGGVIEAGTFGNDTLNGVTISSGSTYTLPNDTSTQLQGTITISPTATIQLNSTVNNTDLQVAGSSATTTLTGGGTVNMSNSSANRIYSVDGTGTLVNDTNNTIQGSGQIGVGLTTIDNKGIIDANLSAGIVISPNGGGVTNTGTLEATAGSQLGLLGTYTNTGGTIKSDGAGSVVQLDSATINGGTLITTNGGVIEPNNTATLNNVTLPATTTYTMPNGTSTLFTAGSTIDGTILMNSTNLNTDLLISQTDGGTVTLSGTANVMMSNSSTNRIYGGGSGDVLVNQTTIQGAGQIGVGLLTLNNQGTINSNLSAGMTIEPAGTLSTNSGTIEATAGSTLNLEGTYANSGTIKSDGAGSVVLLDSTTINGGTLITSNGGLLEPNNTATLNNVTLPATTTYTMPNGTSTLFTAGSTIDGTILMNSTGTNTDLLISQTDGGTVTLSGTANVMMTNNSANRIYGAGVGDVLVNQTTIQGAGQIGVGLLTLNNQGTINSNLSAGMTIEPAGTLSTNSGTLEATAGSTLELIGTFTNTGGGTIKSDGAGSMVLLDSTTINGGTLITSNGGVLEPNNTATLNNVTLPATSTYTMPNSTSTLLTAGTTIDGTILMNSTGTNTDLLISQTDGGTVTLSGTANVMMTNNSANRIYGGGAGDVLVNQGTIQGAGQIGVALMTLENEGIINANQSTAILVDVAGTASTNTNLMEASDGSTLQIEGTLNNTNGTIKAVNGVTGGTVTLIEASISNGILEADGNGVIQGLSTPTLTNLTIQGTGSYVMPDGNDTILVGTITNKANIQMNSTGDITDLLISGNVTLNGGGTVTMGNNPENRFYSIGGAQTLTNADNTIQGAGQLGVGLMGIINNGTILANQSNTLFVGPNATGLTNNGTLQVNSGSLMHVENTGPFNNFSAGTLAGGTYIMNDGTLEIDQLGSTGGEITTLGDGTTATSVILNGASAAITDSFPKNALALATINANASLTIENGNNMTTPGDLSNAGTVTVGTALGDSSTLKLGAGGVNAYTQSGGLTQGTGTIAGAVTIAGGMIQPGLPNAPGTLSITGSYHQTGGTFSEQMFNVSTFGVLNVTGGNVTLSAGADLNITLLNGFDPVGNTYTILNDTGGTVFGTFANAPGSGFQMDGYNWTAAYNGNAIVLDALSAVGGLVTATWNTGTGNWTTATQWSCNPAPVNCVPNNNSSNTYDAVLNSAGAGDTLTLDNSMGAITINNLTLTAGTLDIAAGASLTVLDNGLTDINANSGLILAGTFTNGSQSGLAGLTTVEGTLTLANGQTTSVTP